MPPMPHETRQDEPPALERPHMLSRGALLVLGTVALGLAMLGLLLPLVPAVPFLIAAAACFARAHRPLHDWMLRHRLLGPVLRDWERHRALPPWTKVSLVAVTLLSFTLSILIFAEPAWLKLTLGAVALGVVAALWRIPARPPDPTIARQDEPVD